MSLRTSHTTGSYASVTTRSLSGMMALSVMWMCSGQTSVQHLVMLQRPMPRLGPSQLQAVVGVERVHLQLGEPHEEPRAREGRLVLLVVPDDVADVLAEEALDALAELLAPRSTSSCCIRRVPSGSFGPGLNAGICLAFS